MIDAFDLWEKFCGEYNTAQGGHVRPSRNFINWVNVISRELFQEKFRNGWQKNQKTSDDIGLPFLRSATIAVIPGGPTYEIIPYPKDYGHFSSCRFFHRGDYKGVEVDCKEQENEEGFYYENTNEDLREESVELIANNKWGAIQTHVTKRPKLSSPKITQFDGGFKIAPKGVGTVVLDYLAFPTEATFDYTLGVNDEIIYNPTTSKKLPWSHLVINEFIVRLGLKYGKFTKQPDLYAAADKEKSEL